MKKLIKNIDQVCSGCGIAANYLTCMKKFGRPPKKAAFDISTFHTGTCEFCGLRTSVTQARDFFHPDFELLERAVK